MRRETAIIVVLVCAPRSRRQHHSEGGRRGGGSSLPTKAGTITPFQLLHAPKPRPRPCHDGLWILPMPTHCGVPFSMHPPTRPKSSIHTALFLACVATGASDTGGKPPTIAPRLHKSPSVLSPLAVSFDCALSAFSTDLSPARFPAGSPAPPGDPRIATPEFLAIAGLRRRSGREWRPTAKKRGRQ